MSVLALDISGLPRAWVSYDDAISYHAKKLVAWSLGNVVARYRGGFQYDGSQSYLETPSIIAIKGEGFLPKKQNRVILTNKSLFARDLHMCAYCSFRSLNQKKLSRDHIIPKFHGGQDEWKNVVTACLPCNQKKGCKTLKEAKMELRYIPYEPNHYENLILQNRNILEDQMAYLLDGVPKNSRVLLDLAA